MFEKENLQLSDFITPSIPGREYLSSVKEKVYRKKYSDYYESYSPDKEKLAEIKTWLAKRDEELTIIAIGAKWCPDCTRNIGRLIKIDEVFNDPRFKYGVIGGIKTKLPYLRKKGEPIWKSPPSPPESVDPKFDLSHIPVIFLFNKAGVCLGRIVENPEHTSTLEGEIVHYLEK